MNRCYQCNYQTNGCYQNAGAQNNCGQAGNINAGLNATGAQNGNVTVNNPIVTRQTNVVNRYFYVDQPHIHEMETQYVNHFIKRHTYIPRYICSEQNVYSEVNCGCVQNTGESQCNNNCNNNCNNSTNNCYNNYSRNR